MDFIKLCCVDKGVITLQVLVDSQLVVYRFNGDSRLSNLALSSLMERIWDKARALKVFSLEHVYREFNAKVDHPLKEAVIVQEGVLVIKEFQNNEEGT